MASDQLLTVKDVSLRLGVSESLVYGLVEQGRLAAHRIGRRRGRIRIAEDDLRSYLRQCREVRAPELRKPRRGTQLKHLRL